MWVEGAETDHVLLGHFLTRGDATRRAHISKEEVCHRPDLLRLGGTWMEEVYFEFQFDEKGIRQDLGAVVLALRKEFDDIEIAEWLTRSNPLLDELSPLRWVTSGRDRSRLKTAIQQRGPSHDR